MAVKYVVYEQFENNRMYIGNDDIMNDKVDVFKMDNGGEISDYPGIERREGYYFKDGSSKAWMTYYDGVMRDGLTVRDVGEVEVIESNEKFSVMRFSGGKISGNWYFRKGKDDRVLMWKPVKLNDNEKFTCAKKCTDLSGETKNEKFSVNIKMGENGFGGTALASGVYQGGTGRNLLFTDEFIRKIVDKYKNEPSKIKVDWDHSRDYEGEVREVRLETEPVHRMYVVGDGGRRVSKGASLSLDFDIRATWDDKFKVHKVVDADVLSVTVSNDKPRCKMCYVDLNGGSFQ